MSRLKLKALAGGEWSARANNNGEVTGAALGDGSGRHSPRNPVYPEGVVRGAAAADVAVPCADGTVVSPCAG